MESGRIDLGLALDVAAQVAALIAAHRRGIAHRDIKPENVLPRRDGHVGDSASAACGQVSHNKSLYFFPDWSGKYV